MAEMAAARGAQDFGPIHHELAVGLCGHGILCERLEETRPTAPGFELCLRAKEWIAAARAFVNAGIMRISVFARKRTLGPLLAKDVILLGRQRLLPFLFRFFDFFTHGFASSSVLTAR